MRISKAIAELTKSMETYGDLRICRSASQSARTVLEVARVQVEAVAPDQFEIDSHCARPGDKDGELVIVID